MWKRLLIVPMRQKASTGAQKQEILPTPPPITSTRDHVLRRTIIESCRPSSFVSSQFTVLRKDEVVIEIYVF